MLGSVVQKTQLHPRYHLLPGIAVTLLVAGVALALDHLPVIGRLGPLTIALLLGLAWRAWGPVPDSLKSGIAFSSRQLLRLGIIFLGVRLNLDLIFQAGPRILLLDITIVTAGLAGISWLGRKLGLDPTLASLVAVDSSICGASAVAAAAPTLRARDDETALVIPLCSILGTLVVLGYTLVQHLYPLDSLHYGLLAGSTLHEVAQVMAAVSPFPDAATAGTVTKLTRVVLLVPAIFVLGWLNTRRSSKNKTREKPSTAGPVQKPWFVLWFLVVGIVNSLLLRFLPAHSETILSTNRSMLSISTLLMAMAMAAMGLQVDFGRLRANGLRATVTAVIGWFALATLAFIEIRLLV